MAKMLCTRLENGDIELRVDSKFNLNPDNLVAYNKLFSKIRPEPLSTGFERDGDRELSACVVLLHSHTSDLGVFAAISEFGGILSTMVAIDGVDACGLVKK